MRTSAAGIRPGILPHRVPSSDLHDAALLASVPMTGTLINVAAVLVGTAIGVAVGARLPPGLQQRVLAGLGLVTAVIGVDLALAWRETSALYVLGGVLLGGLAGEALDIEGRLSRLGDRLQARVQRRRRATRPSARRSSPRACSSASAR